MGAVDATPPPAVPQLVELAHAGVKISQLHPLLWLFLEKASRIHLELFNKPLVVTSGNDGKHTEGSKHFRNLAVDLRSRDKGPAEQLLWHCLLAQWAQDYNLAVFDERARDSAPHWHIELAD